MKKILLVLAFVFVNGNLINANSFIEEENIDCHAYAIKVFEVYEFMHIHSGGGEIPDETAAALINHLIGSCWIDNGGSYN